jgi:hypothetical protein
MNRSHRLIGFTWQQMQTGRMRTVKRNHLRLRDVLLAGLQIQMATQIFAMTYFIAGCFLAYLIACAFILDASGWVFVADTKAFWQRLYSALFFEA